MNSNINLQYQTENETFDQSETAGGDFSIAVLVSAIVAASLVMALAIAVTAQTIQI